MLPVGQLNAWLNDPDYYPPDPSKVIKHQFRVRMVAVADAYIRHELDLPGRPFAKRCR